MLARGKASAEALEQPALTRKACKMFAFPSLHWKTEKAERESRERERERAERGGRERLVQVYAGEGARRSYLSSFEGELEGNPALDPGMAFDGLRFVLPSSSLPTVKSSVQAKQRTTMAES